MIMTCPHCGLVIPKVSKVTAGQKKYNEDRKLALDAIRACDAFPSAPRLTICCEGPVHPSALEAAEIESRRLRAALVDPPALWKIYRRRDKSADGYGDVEVIA